MFGRLTPLALKSVAGAALLALASQTPAFAQRPLAGGYGHSGYTTFRPGGYVPTGGHGYFNPVTGANYLPGRAVFKSSGVYTPVGRGYYRNPHTGNVYNPNTGSYSSGRNLSFAPGRYLPGGGGQLSQPGHRLHLPAGPGGGEGQRRLHADRQRVLPEPAHRQRVQPRHRGL